MNHLDIADDLDDFEKEMESFLSKFISRRQHEKFGIVRRVDEIRDWKSFLLRTNRVIHGIGGPGAPKVYEFNRRSECPASVAAVDGPGSPVDVILRLPQLATVRPLRFFKVCRSKEYI